jgi:predicted CDP-diglyceride synthetase/phosphatidate cytidylyltransferase
VTPFAFAVLGLAVLDGFAHRPAKGEAALVLAYLALPYGAIVALPYLPPWAAVLFAAVVGLGAHLSFSRMVGLTPQYAFYAASAACTVAFYAVAPLDWYGLFQALPAFGIFAVVFVGVLRGEPRALLQSVCLAWVGLLVYGYLLGHAAVLAEQPFARFAVSGPRWLAALVFAAKGGDTAWALARRVRSSTAPLQGTTQVLTSAAGSTAAGVALAALGWPLTHVQGAVLGGIMGVALAMGSRAFDLIVADVTGQASDRPLKGTMMFGFSFSLALAYHYLRYLS